MESQNRRFDDMVALFRQCIQAAGTQPSQSSKLNTPEVEGPINSGDDEILYRTMYVFRNGLGHYKALVARHQYAEDESDAECVDGAGNKFSPKRMNGITCNASFNSSICPSLTTRWNAVIPTSGGIQYSTQCCSRKRITFECPIGTR